MRGPDAPEVTMRGSRAIAACFGVTLLLTSSGCGGSEKYESSKACGISTEVVAALVGTDNFTVKSAGADLPFQSDDTSEFTCQVSTADEAPPALDVTARLTSTTELSGFRTNVKSADQTFDVARGSASISTKEDENALEYECWWACTIDSSAGTAVVYMTGETV
ncbi:hypothetical protein [Nocardioides sp. NPDC047086]|uniref:hypothetical protein n=1 Tax=Nocardioides sp. NPDC047086 TaxID=3154810 RepID=UPI0033FAECE2